MRFLLCISGATEIEVGKVNASLPDGQRFEVIEGATGVTPIALQATHVNEDTAVWLVAQRPDHWEIVEQAEVEQLEQMALFA